MKNVDETKNFEGADLTKKEVKNDFIRPGCPAILLEFILTLSANGGKSRVVFKTVRGVAQSGSALVWGTSGRWFKSSRPDHLSKRLSGFSWRSFFLFELYLVFFK